MPFLDRIRCFETLEIRVHSFSKNYTKIDISLDSGEKFILEYKYDHEVELNENLAGLMGATAVINYAFSCVTSSSAGKNSFLKKGYLILQRRFIKTSTLLIL